MKNTNTNNDILFDCQESVLLNSFHRRTFNNAVAFVTDYQKNNGQEINNNFSHDNWKGVAVFVEHFHGFSLKNIPIFGRHTWRPDNLALFFYIRYRKIGLLFIWLYLLFQIIDAIRMRKDSEGVPHTSGLLLNYFVLQTFGFKWTFKFVDWRVENTFKDGWLGVFTRYYNQPNNIRVLEAFKLKEGIKK